MLNPGIRPSAPPTSQKHAEEDSLLNAAMSAHGAGDPVNANQLYRQVLKLNPDSVDALHNLGALALQSGKMNDAIRWFKKTLRRHPLYFDAHCNLGLALKGAGRLEEAVGSYRKAISIDPEIAEAHSNLGVVLKALGRSTDSRAAFKAALKISPEYGDAWSNLAGLNLELGEDEAALKQLRTALSLDPNHPGVLANLGAALIDCGKSEEALTHLEKAIELQPGSPIAHYNLGKALFDTGDLKAAVCSYRTAIDLEPNFADAHHNIGHALLAAGELKEGWEEYDWRWRAKIFRDVQRRFDRPKWDGGDLSGKRLFIWSEQGLGDKILFAGLIPEIARQAGACTLETEARLVPLLARSFPEIEVRERSGENSIEIELTGFDIHAPLGDLPRWTRNEGDKFKPLGTYLKPDRHLAAKCRKAYEKLGDGPIVGISWASTPPKGIELRDLVPVLTMPGITFVNLQYGDHRSEIEIFERETGVAIHTDPTIDPLSDIEGFAAQVSAMDAVLTIQNTTLYVAGGLGVPTFAVLPPKPDWRWLGHREKSPWHDQVYLYPRDGSENNLEKVIRTVAGDLQERTLGLNH